jgi:hypothetical protein
MQPLTTEAEKVISLSGVVLIGVSLVISSGLVLFLLTMIKWQSWDNFFDLMAIAILGIGIYYVSFGLLSFILSKRAKTAAMPAA